MRDTIDMAREAGLFTHKEVQAELKAFEALVRADEREQALAAPVQEPVAWEQFYPDIGKPQLAYMPPTESLDNACYTPPAAQRQRVLFPTMLRKMWSGGEVQAWLDENVNKGNT